VRHRLASYSQESQRYCNYSKGKFNNEVTYVVPNVDEVNLVLFQALQDAEKYYFELLKQGFDPDEARAILPNATKTEIVMTANMREWRHFLKLRLSKHASREIRFIAREILKLLDKYYPVFVADMRREIAWD